MNSVSDASVRLSRRAYQPLATKSSQVSAPISLLPTLPLQGPRFGEIVSEARQGRIDSDIYHLLLEVPKNEIHVHQGGSSSLEFLSYSLRKGVEDGEIKELPLYQAASPPIMVQFKDGEGRPLPTAVRRAGMERVLRLENLREYFRFQMEADNQKNYLSSRFIAETTAHQTPGEAVPPTLDALRQKGLNSYRNTSVKINPYVKNNPAAYLLANEYARNLTMENVRYTEYRVSPTGNGIGGNQGTGIEDVLSAVNAGFQDAKEYLNQRVYPLDFGLIVLFERQNRPGEPENSKVDRAIQTAKDVVRLKQQGLYNIAGVDLAGDEANNPVNEFHEAFSIIKEYNAHAAPENRLGITIHAGETPKSANPAKAIDLAGWQSIEQSIDIASDPQAAKRGQKSMVRIGHGLQLVNSSPALQKAFSEFVQHPDDWEKRIDIRSLKAQSPLLAKVIQQGVVLEMCPKSNLQTYGIYPNFPNDPTAVSRDTYTESSYRHHPAVFLSRLGVKVAISSDNRTISNTDVTNEFVKLQKYSGLTYNDLKAMIMNGFEGAFIADPKRKAAMMKDVERQFTAIEHRPDSIRAIRKLNGSLTLWQRLIDGREQLTSFVFQALEKLLDALRGWDSTSTRNRSRFGS